MTRKIDEFVPRSGNTVKIFTCGPSIYQRPHIGNYRTFLYEDLVVRFLEFSGYKVERIINFTDVEDKSIEEAGRKNQATLKLTKDVSKHFYAETAKLKIKLPPEIPSSSTSIPEAVHIIEKLLESGHAYWDKGDVFFDPLKHPGFGRLFGLDMSRWPQKKVRFRKDTYNGKRWNLGDFILWHGHRDGHTTTWETAIGRGRPSWNIQDPAMIIKHLGDQVDINCGGIDNIYRHHDYNIAVMESYSGKEYANYFMHGAHLIVDGVKMSKSRGNILYPEHVLKKGVRPEHLRFFLTYTHYRTQLNFTFKAFEAHKVQLDAVRKQIKGLISRGKAAAVNTNTACGAVSARIKALPAEFAETMGEDLSIGKAFDRLAVSLDEIAVKSAEKELSAAQRSALEKGLKKIDSVCGYLL